MALVFRSVSSVKRSYTDVGNLVRFQDSLKRAAQEAVHGQLLIPQSVSRVIAKIRHIYGRTEQQLQSHLDKVRKLEPPRADKLASFIPFGNKSRRFRKLRLFFGDRYCSTVTQTKYVY